MKMKEPTAYISVPTALVFASPSLDNDMLAMPRQCGYCGMVHGPRCPSVKAIEFHPNGSVKRVEFFGPNYNSRENETCVNSG
jgi:hypothetical protein